MEMTARILCATGALIYLFLGTMHLLYTFFTPKFRTVDPAVEEAMKKTTPRLTKQTTLWKAWMGFNASHSTGAMFFGFMILYFSVGAFPLFGQSILLQAIVLLNSAFYLGLAKTYWFNIPLSGIALATVCFTIAILLIHA